MLGVTILAVGRLKEDYLNAACAEYIKRLGAYSKTAVIEIDEERLAKGRGTEAVLQAEGARILSRVPGSGYVITLDVGGQQLCSDEFVRLLARTMSGGSGHVTFIIGGSLGLSPEVSRRADMALSFSKMTLPHQLMRVVLLEQIYRALNILHGGKYHK